MNDALQELLTDIVGHANDADHLRDEMTLDDWTTMLSRLETVHYLCMDARRIVKRRIRSAQHRVQATEEHRA